MKSLPFIKLVVLFLSLSIALVYSSLTSAETAVIVHPSNSAVISPDDIQRIFLGKLKSFPAGGEAIPVNQNAGKPERAAFFEIVLQKSESQVKSYWSRLVFTGKGTPPKEVGGSADVVKIVGANPNLIGYVDAAAVDGSVKVVHKF